MGFCKVEKGERKFMELENGDWLCSDCHFRMSRESFEELNGGID